MTDEGRETDRPIRTGSHRDREKDREPGRQKEKEEQAAQR